MPLPVWMVIEQWGIQRKRQRHFLFGFFIHLIVGFDFTCATPLFYEKNVNLFRWINIKLWMAISIWWNTLQKCITQTIFDSLLFKLPTFFWVLRFDKLFCVISELICWVHLGSSIENEIQETESQWSVFCFVNRRL